MAGALAHDPDYADKAARISALTRDLSELLPDLVGTLKRPLTSATLQFSYDAKAFEVLGVDEGDLLRTGQEALTNAVRHAGARHIALTLDYQDAAVCLAVTDDGHGLATGPSDGTDGGTKGGFGLSGMRARARAIGAKFNLRSAPGAGTTIELIVPHV